MPTMTDGLVDEMKAHLKSARDISDAVDQAGREFTAEESTQLKELLGKAQDCKSRIEKAKGDAAVKAAIADLGDGIGLNEKSTQAKVTPSGLIVPDGRKSIGQHFVESESFKTLLGTAPPSGVFHQNHRINTRPLGYKSLLGPKSGQKALVTGASDTSAGAFVQNDFLGLQGGLNPFQRPLTLRDLVTPGTTTSDTIEYVQVTAVTNNAAPVAEATSAGPQTVSGSALVNAAGGGYKPESAMTVGRVTAPVRTIAHWIPVTKRALADAAQMTTLIDNFLQYGLEEELEDQMVAGNGSGENFTGFANISGVQTQAFSTDLLTTTRKAKTKVRVTGRAQPNGYLINPADMETIDLTKDGNSQFYFGGPAEAGGNTTLWGLPVVESEAVPAGTAYCGDFTKAILWDREEATITSTDSHMDFYTRNLVAILAELRAAFGVLQPSAIVKIALS